MSRGFLARYDEWDWRTRVRWWFARYGNRWDDWLCQTDDGGLTGWLSHRDWAYYGDGGWGRVVCLIVGHSPVQDHCGRPEHDYCPTCYRIMPGAAH